MTMQTAAIRPILVDLEAVAVFLSIDEADVFALVDRGKLPAIHIGERLVYHVDDVMAFADYVAFGCDSGWDPLL